MARMLGGRQVGVGVLLLHSVNYQSSIVNDQVASLHYSCPLYKHRTSIVGGCLGNYSEIFPPFNNLVYCF